MCVCLCKSAFATVGALYQADCMVGDRLATCLFWDCTFHCIPALILETVRRRGMRRDEGLGQLDAGRKGGRDVVVKTVRESWWEGQWGCEASLGTLIQHRWCYGAAASPPLLAAPAGGVTLWNQSRSGLCHCRSPWYFHFRCMPWHRNCANTTCRPPPVPSFTQPLHSLTTLRAPCLSLLLSGIPLSSLLIRTSDSQWVTDCQATVHHPALHHGRARSRNLWEQCFLSRQHSAPDSSQQRPMTDVRLVLQNNHYNLLKTE